MSALSTAGQLRGKFSFRMRALQIQESVSPAYVTSMSVSQDCGPA